MAEMSVMHISHRYMPNMPTIYRPARLGPLFAAAFIYNRKSIETSTAIPSAPGAGFPSRAEDAFLALRQHGNGAEQRR